MRILLLTPPPGKKITADMPDIFDDNVGFYPPLGLMYLSSTLKHACPDDDIRLIDSVVEELDKQSILEKVLDFQPGIIGITVMTFLVVEVYECVAAIKQRVPDVRIVFGGPHVHLFPEEILLNPHVDYLIAGEGERSFPYFVECLKQEADLSRVPGLVYRGENGSVRKGASC